MAQPLWALLILLTQWLCRRDDLTAVSCLAQSRTPHSRCPLPMTPFPLSVSLWRFHSVCAHCQLLSIRSSAKLFLGHPRGQSSTGRGRGRRIHSTRPCSKVPRSLSEARGARLWLGQQPLFTCSARGLRVAARGPAGGGGGQPPLRVSVCL